MRNHDTLAASPYLTSNIFDILVQAFLCLPFSLCAFFVASTANAGFNVVLTALINSAFAAGAYHVLQNTVVTPAAVGFLIGCSCMETALSLMTAVYWGQLSKCEITKLSISQYSCDNKVAYGAVSAFATLLFLIQTIFTGSLIGWNEDIIDDDLQASTASSSMVSPAAGVRPDPNVSVYRNIPTVEDRSNADIEVVAVADKDPFYEDGDTCNDDQDGANVNIDGGGNQDIQIVV